MAVMPELPEVETVVRMLRGGLAGAMLGNVLCCRADMVYPPGINLARLLPGRQVSGVGRRGKRILIHLGDGEILCVHLGMTGQLTICPAEASVKSHTHLIVELGQSQLRLRDVRRFGELRWITNPADAEEGLGPEPLTVAPRALAKALARTRRSIKVTLLDQKVIAGIGNIYADESLHRAGIHPRTPANRLSAEQVKRLGGAIKRVLREAIAHKGSSLRDYVMVNGESGGYQNMHRVYGRGGEACRKCGLRIRRIVLGGRSTCFCPGCQRR
jgi:formamidopyrimidine-DNA glycosylase